ncbi:MAG: hypothetical protein ACM357_05210 [Gemmatimonadota bacterium]
MPSLRAALVPLALLAASCLRPDAGADGGVAPLTVERIAEGTGTRLQVVAPEGVKLSAAVQPVLELDDGRTVRFESEAVSTDSLYFTAPPTGWIEARPDEVRGVLNAGICDEETSTCRRVTVEI